MFEQELAAKSPAPRVTQADIDAAISAEFYGTAHDIASAAASINIRHDDNAAEPALRLLTICVLVLRNGYTVTGTSACASPENFDADIGRRIARENAVRQIWPLLGYTLKDRLAAQAEFLAI